MTRVIHIGENFQALCGAEPGRGQILGVWQEATCRACVLRHRTPEGHINNCALANGANEADCQICGGDCPDSTRFITPDPSSFALASAKTVLKYDDQDLPAERVAEKQGLVVVYPESNELQIDIDSDEAFVAFLEQFERLKRIEPEIFCRIAFSKSGPPNRHITVMLARPIASHEERILLQALLCSDPVRELLSLIRLRRGAERPTRFFEKPTDETTTPNF